MIIVDSLLVQNQDAVVRASIDKNYLKDNLPYSNLEDIQSYFQSIPVQEGLTVLVKENNELKEYWYTSSGWDLKNANTSDLLTTIQSLQETVTELRQAVDLLQGSTTSVLSNITVNKAYISGNANTSDGTVVVTAVYNNGNTAVVTNECTGSSSNTNVAVWNNGIHLVSVGDAVITLTYSVGNVTRTATINVTVLDSNQVTQYAGWATSISQILGNSEFATNTVAGTWTPANTPIISADPVYFFVATTETITTFGQTIAYYNLADIYQGDQTYNGITYKIYRTGSASPATLPTFTITT